MRQKGSTSVFFCLMLLLVSSLLFTLLEGSRIEGLKANIRMNSSLVTESVLAEYVTPLWEKYCLLAGNGGDEKGQWKIDMLENTAYTLTEENLTWCSDEKRGLWLYPLDVDKVNVTEYRLFTDDGGAGFYQSVVKYMEQNMAVDTVEAIYQKIKGMQDTSESAGDMDAKVEDAKDCMEEAAELESTEAGEVAANTESVAAENANDSEDTAEWEDGKDMENPLEYIGTWKSTAVLTLLGADTEKLSGKTVDLSQSLENRQKQKGNWKGEVEDEEWYGKVLFLEYMLKHFHSYPTGEQSIVKNQGGLDYGIEYLIAGKKSDASNLESVLGRILILREAANFIYLQTDKVKKSEALTLATLLVGVTGNGLLIKGVQQGILAVWAFAESVSDVKSLLAGERIPIVKSKGEWSTDVGALAKNSEFNKADKCEKGLSYEDYLRVLLFLTDREELCYRAMDLMEWEIRELCGYENLRMDMLWDKCKLNYSYQAKKLFLSPNTDTYQWSIEEIAAY